LDVDRSLTFAAPIRAPNVREGLYHSVGPLALAALLFVAFTQVRAAAPAKLAVDICGQSQEVHFYASTVKPPTGRILFAPGDGGWRGFAPTLAETASSWGYEVHGFDQGRLAAGGSDGRYADVGGEAAPVVWRRVHLRRVVGGRRMSPRW
jgi:hypothetical protein